jgi:hypothetical protein
MSTKKTVPQLEQNFLAAMAELENRRSLTPYRERLKAARDARDEYYKAWHAQQHGVSAVFKVNGTEILRRIPAATEFYEMYEYQPQPLTSSRPPEINPLDCPPVRSMRFKLSEIDSEGRYVYLPAN